jgi:hypothetical protein
MNIQDMSIDAIQNRLSEVLAEMAGIKFQIESAKTKQIDDGIDIDKDWLNRANMALRLKGREQQVLQIEFGKKRKEERRAINLSMERMFIEICRARLDESLFSEIWEEAKYNHEFAIEPVSV